MLILMTEDAPSRVPEAMGQSGESIWVVEGYTRPEAREAAQVEDIPPTEREYPAVVQLEEARRGACCCRAHPQGRQW
jgi:hypothetical protein